MASLKGLAFFKGDLSARVFARRWAIAVFTAYVAVLFGAAALSPAWTLVSLLCVVLWAAIWPISPEAQTSAAPLLEPAPTETQLLAGGHPMWRRMLDAITDPALMLDRDQRIVGANGGALALLPECRDRLIAQVLRDPGLLSGLERALQTRQSQTFDMHMAIPVGRHLSVVLTPMATQEPMPPTPDPALMIVFRDRTETEQLAQMRADFVANASHELRTPLASLKGFVETLQGAAKDDPAARETFLGIMQEQAERMSRLIEDLLSLSRVEMRQHVPPTGIVDVAGVIGEATQALTKVATDEGVTIVGSAVPVTVLVVGDRDELVQVVQNLTQNAIKYGRRGGHVRVSVAVEGNRVALTVADDGIGVAPQNLARLTERFFRVSNKDSRERGGTGLGLAIVKHIVNRHRGELRIESTLGKGSSFTVLLPSA